MSTQSTVYHLDLDYWTTPDGPTDHIDGYDSGYYFPEGYSHQVLGDDADALIAWAQSHTAADAHGIAPKWTAKPYPAANGPIPPDAIAWKHQDPTEPARWVCSEADYQEIAAQDDSLLIRVVR